MDPAPLPGQPVRVLVAKPGLDGHDRGAKVVALALVRAGCEVIYTGLHKSIEQIVAAAADEDVDVVGISILSGAHVHLTRALLERLRAEGLDGVRVLVGGNIPHADRARLLELGAAAVFPTGANLDEISRFVVDLPPRARRCNA